MKSSTWRSYQASLKHIRWSVQLTYLTTLALLGTVTGAFSTNVISSISTRGFLWLIVTSVMGISAILVTHAAIFICKRYSPSMPVWPFIVLSAIIPSSLGLLAIMITLPVFMGSELDRDLLAPLFLRLWLFAALACLPGYYWLGTKRDAAAGSAAAVGEAEIDREEAEKRFLERLPLAKRET